MVVTYLLLVKGRILSYYVYTQSHSMLRSCDAQGLRIRMPTFMAGCVQDWQAGLAMEDLDPLALHVLARCSSLQSDASKCSNVSLEQREGFGHWSSSVPVMPRRHCCLVNVLLQLLPSDALWNIAEPHLESIGARHIDEVKPPQN